MRTTRPRCLPDFKAYRPILDEVTPFLTTGGRALVRLPSTPADPPRAFGVRSRAFRDWFFAQCDHHFDSVPTAHTFQAICRHLEARATVNPARRDIYVPVSSRKPTFRS